jgi:hypothetical protein
MRETYTAGEGSKAQKRTKVWFDPFATQQNHSDAAGIAAPIGHLWCVATRLCWL